MSLAILSLFSMALPVLPMMLVWTVGIFFAISLKERHPTASLLAAVAFGMLLISSVVSIGITWYTIHMSEVESLGWTLGVLNFFRTAISTAAEVLIVVALFKRRPPVPAASA